MRFVPFVLAASAIGCASLATLPPFRRTPPPVTPAPPVASRPIPYPMVESHAFARAVARGTRTRTGEPGPNYWQQFARYRITAELVPATSQVTGRETVWYFNHSPDTLPEVYFFLDQNLFAPTSPRNTPTPVTGGTELLRVAVRRTRAVEGGHRRRVLGRRNRAARRTAARARAARLGRPRHRVGVSGAAGRRAARRDDRATCS